VFYNSVIKIHRKLPCLALDIPERSVNWNLTLRYITLYCSIYQLHAAPIPRVWQLIIGVLLFFYITCTVYNFTSLMMKSK